MKKNKITHFLKLGTLIIGVILALTSCESEEIIIQKEPIFKTVSIDGTQTYLENLINSNSAGRTTNSIPFILDLKNINQEPIINSNQLLTIIPAATKYHHIYSRVLVIKVNDTIKSVVINMTKSNDYKHYSGIISITDLYGNFINGFRVKNGELVSKFINNSRSAKKSNSNRNSYTNCPDPYDTYSGCFNSLEEVVISSSNKISLYYFFIYDSAQLEFSSGGSNNETWDYSNSGGGGDSQYNEPTNYCPNGYIDAFGNCVEDDKIINNLTNPCANGILENLKETNRTYFSYPIINLPNGELKTFSGFILDLFEKSTKNYTFENNYLSDSNAITMGRDRGIVTIMSDDYLNKATTLSIARTMIHESVHAYIMDQNSGLNFTFKDAIEKYGMDNGYNINGSDEEVNRFHHEFMGQYIDAMAYSLYIWDKDSNNGGNLGWEYYKSMAFGGLFYKDNNGNLIETDSFKKLIPNANERELIIKILQNEQDGNNNAKGEKC